MACTPFPAPAVGLFENSTQGVWANFNESKGGRSCAYSGGTLTVTGPNGSTSFLPPAGGSVRHKFFGTGNFLAVMTTEAGPGTVTRTLSIIDFTAPAITSEQVIFVNADSTNSLPWVQNSPGVGSACLVGAPTSFGVAGLAIYRSDTGAVICPGPTPYNPSGQVIGEVIAGGSVRIKDGGSVIAGPCAVPAGALTVQPASQAFATVKVGGCPQPPSTRQYTLRNSGTDCLTITAVAAAGPFSVTAQSKAFPAVLAPSETMTVTVTFAPSASGNFTSDLAISRTPAAGADHLTCTGTAQPATAAFTVPGLVAFGTVQVGASAARTVTVTNSGSLPISVSVPASPAGSPFAWAAFSGPLGCGQSIGINVTFTPQAAGQGQVVMAIAGSPGGTQNVTLQGTGCIPQAVIAVPPAPFPAFGDVRQGYRLPRFIAVRNTGNAPLTFRASISGPDAAMFGLMDTSQSIVNVLGNRVYSVDPTSSCGGGATGDGAVEVVVVVFANATPPAALSATLTLDNHNDPSAPASYTFALSANVVAGNVVDVVAVFDTSGSMSGGVPGGGTKEAAAIQAGKLLVGILPPDLTNRIAGVRFSTDASIFLAIDEVTSANQAGKVAAVADPPLTPSGSTAIAAGIMTGLPALATPRPGPAPAILTKAAIVLTDGLDNTAYLNPADGLYYSILGGSAGNPAGGGMVATRAFVPPTGVKIFAIGMGTGQDIDTAQLASLASGAGGYYLVVDPTRPAITYELMKLYTQIYMDMVDTAVISDPRYTINAGDKQVFEFDVLAGDVTGTVVVYDFDGLRLPFWLESPAGEIVDAAFVPPGFQLRSGFTDTSRFLDFVLPWGEPKRYAGRWRLVVEHRGIVCRGWPKGQEKELGFLPRDCGESKDPVDYGFVIGVGSNFRLDAFVTPAPLRVGDPIRLTAIPSEAGLPVIGCTVTVDVTSPSGVTWTGITLQDDGAHEDGDAADGEYGKVFSNTAEAGSYTFRFRASGQSRDGEPVNREAIRSKYLEGTVKPPDGSDSGRDDCCDELRKLSLRQVRLLEAMAKSPTRARASD
jgi:hypothetical protein